MNPNNSEGTTPFVTVGVPTFNRAWSLPIFLDALQSLDYPKTRIRIVFVDNNSTDGTVQFIQQFVKSRRKDYEDIRLISMISNIPLARNMCIDNSAGEYIFFLDSDVIPPPESVKRMLKVFGTNPNVAIVGFRYYSRLVTYQQKDFFDMDRRGLYSELLIQAGCTMINLRVFENREVQQFVRFLRRLGVQCSCL